MAANEGAEDALDDAEIAIPRIVDTLCATFGLKNRHVSVVVPDALLSPCLEEALLSRPEVVGLFVPRTNVDANGRQRTHVGTLEFATGNVTYPDRSGSTAVVLVPLMEFRRRFVLDMLKHGVTTLVVWDGATWQSISSLRYLAASAITYLIGRVSTLMPAGPRFLSLKPREMARRPGLVRLLQRGTEKFCARAYQDVLPLSDGYGPATDYQPRRIVLVNGGLAPGGAERQLVNTCLELRSSGFQDLTVVCSMLNGAVQGLDLDFHRATLESAGIATDIVKGAAGVPFSHVPMGREIGRLTVLGRFPVHMRAEVAAYYREFMDRRPEIVHLWQDQTSIVGGIAAVLAQVPRILLSTRNIAPIHFPYFHPWMRSGYKALLRFPNVRLLANSAAGAKSYADWLGIPEEKIVVIRNGFDFRPFQAVSQMAVEDLRRSLGLPDGVPVVGGVFRLWPEKNPLLWVETAAELARRNDKIVFLLVGSGPMLEEVMSLARKHGILHKLYLPGTLSEIGAAMRLMDVFLLTSSAEGLPNVVIEAQAMGTPVVVTNGGGAAEALLDGQTGWVVNDYDPLKLADRVMAILDHREWRTNAAQRAPEFVQENFGLQRMIGETLSIYFPEPTRGNE